MRLGVKEVVKLVKITQQVIHKMFMWKVLAAKRLRNTTQMCETT